MTDSYLTYHSACAAAVVKASVLGNYGKTGDFLCEFMSEPVWNGL